MPGKPTCSAQIVVMQSIGQQGAAWLLGVTTSWIRDHGFELPRDKNGKYNARELLEWRISRPVDVEFPDGEKERLLQAADIVAVEIGGAAFAIQKLLLSLREQYGDAGLAEFARAVVAAVGDDPAQPATDAEINGLQDAEASQQRWFSRSRQCTESLTKVHQCEHCGKVRNGSRWVKAGKKHCEVGRVRMGLCDRCERADQLA